MKTFKIILLSFLIAPSWGWSPPLPRLPWDKRVALSIKQYLWSHGEKQLPFHQPQGKVYLYTIDEAYLLKIVDADLDAAIFNKSWGPRRLVALKEICYQYGESRFDCYAVNINKCGSIDVGIGQINSVHWLYLEKNPMFNHFCELESIKPNLKLLWNPYFNACFSAMLNEDFIHVGQHTYNYYSSDSQKGLYDCLLKTCGYEALAEQYNDGQYVPPIVELSEK